MFSNILTDTLRVPSAASLVYYSLQNYLQRGTDPTLPTPPPPSDTSPQDPVFIPPSQDPRCPYWSLLGTVMPKSTDSKKAGVNPCLTTNTDYSSSSTSSGGGGGGDMKGPPKGPLLDELRWFQLPYLPVFGTRDGKFVTSSYVVNTVVPTDGVTGNPAGAGIGGYMYLRVTLPCKKFVSTVTTVTKETYMQTGNCKTADINKDTINDIQSGWLDNTRVLYTIPNTNNWVIGGESYFAMLLLTAFYHYSVPTQWLNMNQYPDNWKSRLLTQSVGGKWGLMTAGTTPVTMTYGDSFWKHRVSPNFQCYVNNGHQWEGDTCSSPTCPIPIDTSTFSKSLGDSTNQWASYGEGYNFPSGSSHMPDNSYSWIREKIFMQTYKKVNGWPCNNHGFCVADQNVCLCTGNYKLGRDGVVPGFPFGTTVADAFTSTTSNVPTKYGYFDVGTTRIKIGRHLDDRACSYDLKQCASSTTNGACDDHGYCMITSIGGPQSTKCVCSDKMTTKTPGSSSHTDCYCENKETVLSYARGHCVPEDSTCMQLQTSNGEVSSSTYVNKWLLADNAYVSTQSIVLDSAFCAHPPDGCVSKDSSGTIESWIRPDQSKESTTPVTWLPGFSYGCEVPREMVGDSELSGGTCISDTQCGCYWKDSDDQRSNGMYGNQCERISIQNDGVDSPYLSVQATANNVRTMETGKGCGSSAGEVLSDSHRNPGYCFFDDAPQLITPTDLRTSNEFSPVAIFPGFTPYTDDFYRKPDGRNSFRFCIPVVIPGDDTSAAVYDKWVASFAGFTQGPPCAGTLSETNPCPFPKCPADHAWYKCGEETCGGIDRGTCSITGNDEYSQTCTCKHPPTSAPNAPTEGPQWTGSVCKEPSCYPACQNNGTCTLNQVGNKHICLCPVDLRFKRYLTQASIASNDNHMYDTTYAFYTGDHCQTVNPKFDPTRGPLVPFPNMKTVLLPDFNGQLPPYLDDTSGTNNNYNFSKAAYYQACLPQWTQIGTPRVEINNLYWCQVPSCPGATGNNGEHVRGFDECGSTFRAVSNISLVDYPPQQGSFPICSWGNTGDSLNKYVYFNFLTSTKNDAKCYCYSDGTQATTGSTMYELDPTTGMCTDWCNTGDASRKAIYNCGTQTSCAAPGGRYMTGFDDDNKPINYCQCINPLAWGGSRCNVSVCAPYGVPSPTDATVCTCLSTFRNPLHQCQECINGYQLSGDLSVQSGCLLCPSGRSGFRCQESACTPACANSQICGQVLGTNSLPIIENGVPKYKCYGEIAPSFFSSSSTATFFLGSSSSSVSSITRYLSSSSSSIQKQLALLSSSSSYSTSVFTSTGGNRPFLLSSSSSSSTASKPSTSSLSSSSSSSSSSSGSFPATLGPILVNTNVTSAYNSWTDFDSMASNAFIALAIALGVVTILFMSLMLWLCLDKIPSDQLALIQLYNAEMEAETVSGSCRKEWKSLDKDRLKEKWARKKNITVTPAPASASVNPIATPSPPPTAVPATSVSIPISSSSSTTPPPLPPPLPTTPVPTAPTATAMKLEGKTASGFRQTVVSYFPKALVPAWFHPSFNYTQVGINSEDTVCNAEDDQDELTSNFSY